MGRLERVTVYYREFLCKSEILENVNVQWLTWSGNVAVDTIVTVLRPDGRYQNATIIEARPTANCRDVSSEKEEVKRRTPKPIRRSINAQRELIYIWVR